MFITTHCHIGYFLNKENSIAESHWETRVLINFSKWQMDIVLSWFSFVTILIKHTCFHTTRMPTTIANNIDGTRWGTHTHCQQTHNSRKEKQSHRLGNLHQTLTRSHTISRMMSSWQEERGGTIPRMPRYIPYLQVYETTKMCYMHRAIFLKNYIFPWKY